MTDKAKRFHHALYDQMGDKEGLSQQELDERKAKRDSLRRQLPSNIFIQFLAGPSDLRGSSFGRQEISHMGVQGVSLPTEHGFIA